MAQSLRWDVESEGEMVADSGGRVQRVPFDVAERLVGERALSAAASADTLRYNWRKHGVPPERLCWLLIEAIDAERVSFTRPDAPAVERVRSILAMTGGRGPEWRFLDRLIEQEHGVLAKRRQRKT